MPEEALCPWGSFIHVAACGGPDRAIVLGNPQQLCLLGFLLGCSNCKMKILVVSCLEDSAWLLVIQEQEDGASLHHPISTTQFQPAWCFWGQRLHFPRPPLGVGEAVLFIGCREGTCDLFLNPSSLFLFIFTSAPKEEDAANPKSLVCMCVYVVSHQALGFLHCSNRKQCLSSH